MCYYRLSFIQQCARTNCLLLNVVLGPTVVYSIDKQCAIVNGRTLIFQVRRMAELCRVKVRQQCTAKNEWPTSDVNTSETGYQIYLKINVRRVASGNSLHFNF